MELDNLNCGDSNDQLALTFTYTYDSVTYSYNPYIPGSELKGCLSNKVLNLQLPPFDFTVDWTVTRYDYTGQPDDAGSFDITVPVNGTVDYNLQY